MAGQTLAEIEAATKLAKAKADLATEEARLLTAEKALAAAQKPVEPEKPAAKPAPDPAASALAAEVQRKAKAEADLARTNADAAAFKAATVGPADSGVAGTVTAATNAGALEASLMTARQLDTHAQAIASSIRDNAGVTAAATATAPAAKYLVFAGLKKPTLGDWQQFAIRMRVLANGYQRAAQRLGQAKAAVADLTAAAGAKAAPIAIAAAGIELLSKFGSYFRNDYTVAPAAIAGIDDELLATSLAGHLGSAALPGRWPPSASADAVVALLQPLATQNDAVLAAGGAIAAMQRDVTAMAVAETDPARKARFAAAQALLTAAVDSNAAAAKGYDALLEWLASSDAAGTPAVAKVIEQQAIAARLAGGAVAVLVQVAGSAATTYAKKNLWTFLLPGMPFFVAGGAVVSYTVFKGDGTVLLSRQDSVYTGFRELDEVRSEIAERR